MTIYTIKPRFQALLRPLVAALVVARVAPDWLTGGAVAVAAAMGMVLLRATPEGAASLWLVAAGAALRLTLNALDGEVARAQGRAGSWGEAKNELGDRAADALIFGALALAPYTTPALAVPALAVALLTGTVGILGKATTGERRYEGPLGKPDRMAALALVSGAVALTGRWWLWDALLAATALLGMLTIRRRLEAIHGRG